MPPLEQLFALEIEYHRKLRQEAPGTADPSGLHTSYALQSGYEPLLRHIGRVTAHDLDHLAKRLMSMDPNRYEVSEPELLRGLSLSGRGSFLHDGP